MARSLRGGILFVATHLVTGILTFLAMYGVANLYLVFPVTFLDVVLLYAWVLTLIILPIQAGIQIWSLLQLTSTPLLLTYYFQYDSTSTLPHRFLDPVQSRIGLITVILLLIGGLVAWPIYSVYGGFLLIARFGIQLFTPEFLILFIQGLSVGASVIFVMYFLLASFSILVLQWRRRRR
ncbi:MAG: hypothetical protein ACFFDJ_10280 [Candidatus Odinarchaeota archaeon]